MGMRDTLIDMISTIAVSTNRWKMLLVIPSGVLFFSILIGFILLSPACDRVLHFPPFPPAPFHFMLFFLFTVPGVFLVLRCGRLFRSAGGTPVPLHPPERLVIDGPYALVRNPMVTGMFLILYSIGCLWQSLSLLALVLPALILLSFLELRYIEEPELERRLGAPYTSYKRAVPMFIPRLHRHR